MRAHTRTSGWVHSQLDMSMHIWWVLEHLGGCVHIWCVLKHLGVRIHIWVGAHTSGWVLTRLDVCSRIWVGAHASGGCSHIWVGARISGWVHAHLDVCSHIWWGSAPCLPCILLTGAFHQRPHDEAPAPKCSAQHIPSRKSFNAPLLGFFFPNPPLHPGQHFNFWNFLPCECLISQWHRHTGSGVHS